MWAYRAMLWIPVALTWIIGCAPTEIITLEPLSVINIAPPHGAASIDPTTTVVISFSRALDPSTISSDTVLLTQLDDTGADVLAVTAEVIYSEEAFSVIITPSEALMGETTYQITLTTEVADADGEQLAAEIASTFTTV